MSSTYDLLAYLREDQLPHTMCPGCGGGTVLNAFAKAVDGLPLTPDDLLLVSGIGCSAWIPSPHFDADTLHTTHGRAIAYATGAKVANPDLETVVISGDGDLAGIGGNHLLHAARRNVDLTVILVNNFTYGMTGGQVAPTTLHGATTTTSPYGNPEDAMDVSAVAAEAGAAYVARQPTSRPHQLVAAIERAIETDGFALVEVVSQCPTVFGRRNDLPSAPEMLHWIEEQIADGELTVGTIAENDRPEFVSALENTVAVAVGEHESRTLESEQTEWTLETQTDSARIQQDLAETDGAREDLRLRIAGVGGQGVVVAGTILGEAAALEGRNVFKTEEYSSRARGGPATADLIVTDDEIHEAKVPDGEADVLVALTPSALEANRSVVRDDGTIYVDAGEFDEAPEGTIPVPFADLAHEAGSERSINVAVLGYLNEAHDVVSPELLRTVVGDTLEGYEAENEAAFDRGVAVARGMD